MSFGTEGWGGHFETEPKDTEEELSEDLLTFKEQWEAACTDFPELFAKVIKKLDKIKDESKQRTQLNALDKQLIDASMEDEESVKVVLNSYLKGARADTKETDDFDEDLDDEDIDEDEETVH